MNKKIVNSRECVRCKSILPLTREFFRVNGRTPDGFSYPCKGCMTGSYHRSRLPIEDLKKLLNQRLVDLKTRTKKKRVKHPTTLDFDSLYLMELYKKQQGKCALSGISMTYTMFAGHNNTNVSIDRIDSTKGYVKENIQLVCCIVNKMKFDLTVEEFLTYCKKIIQHND